MYGDTTVIRGLAGRLRDQGSTIRAEATDLVGRAEAVPWTGRAADAMRELVRAQVAGLRVCADRHDEAAAALERHAREVDHLVEVIGEAEHWVGGLLVDAGAAARGLASRVVPGLADDWLDHFQPPPPGSLDWLQVRIPIAG